MQDFVVLAVKDEVLDGEPLYTIQDKNGKILYDNVKLSLKTPLTEIGTPLNKVLFDIVDDNFALIKSEFGNVDNKFQEIDSNSQQVNNKLSEIDNKFADVEQDIQTINNNITNVKNEVSAINRYLENKNVGEEYYEYIIDGLFMGVKTPHVIEELDTVEIIEENEKIEEV